MGQRKARGLPNCLLAVRSRAGFVARLLFLLPILLGCCPRGRLSPSGYWYFIPLDGMSKLERILQKHSHRTRPAIAMANGDH